jgi:peroxiredoxin Q/BCP
VNGSRRDPSEAHQRLRNKHGLRFPLLTDADHDAYGAWGEPTRYGKTSVGVLRSTLVIDPEGRIRRAWHDVKADGHAAAVGAALDR